MSQFDWVSAIMQKKKKNLQMYEAFFGAKLFYKSQVPFYKSQIILHQKVFIKT